MWPVLVEFRLARSDGGWKKERERKKKIESR